MRSKRLPNLFVVRQPPVPRAEVFDMYWTFAARRQEIFARRLSGAAGPWTDDPILQQYKFCNVYRAADRVSQFLIRRVACCPIVDSVKDRLFRIVAFRTFSKPAMWDYVIAWLGHEPNLLDLADGRFEVALDAARTAMGGLYTGAFILCANKAFGFDEKHRNHVALFQEMFLKQSLADRIMDCGSLRQLVELLQSFPLIGPFMAYQIAIDINYSEHVNFDENEYTQAGPGALRGLAKAFVSYGDFSASELIQSMVETQGSNFERLGLRFGGLWGRPLHAIDCQGLFCEIDKYSRVAFPELRSARSRIKARFVPNPESVKYTFPKKWDLKVS